MKAHSHGSRGGGGGGAAIKNWFILRMEEVY
jgi:hypothetical protein